MKIGKYLELHAQKVVTCAPQERLADVAKRLTENGLCGAPVCDEEGRMVGIISDRDIVRALGEKLGDAATLQVSDVMTDSVMSCSPDQEMVEVRKIMRDRGFRNVPIVEGDSVVGVIGVRDALRTRIDQKELEINVLKDTVIAARA